MDISEKDLYIIADKLLSAYDLHTKKGEGTVGIRKVFVDILKQFDANLIKQGDELLEACKRLLKADESLRMRSGGCATEWVNAKENAKQVISKAEGK